MQSNGFTRNADLYRSSHAHSELEDLESCLGSLPPLPGLSCLDVATGTGHTSFFLAKKQAHVFAVDINDEMLRVAQEEADRQSLAVRFLKSPAEDLFFDDEAFDLVTCRLASHHFQDCQKFLSEVARVLRKGGHLLLIDNVVPEDSGIADWLNSFERQRDPSHQACLTPSKWRELLEQEAFKILKSEPFFKKLDFELWLHRMSVEGELAEQLWRELLEAPEQVRDFWKPQIDEKQQKTFTLCRQVMVAQLNALEGSG